MLDHIGRERHNDAAFHAKLHGFKLNTPLEVHEWTEEEDKRLQDFAHQEYVRMTEEAKRRAEQLKGVT